MTNKPLTVYFDTSFYIWLAKVDTEEAKATVDELNKMQIRHVLSAHVLHELLSGSRSSDRDRVLVERVKSLNIEPYRVQVGVAPGGDNIEWEILLLSGAEREAFAKFLQAIFSNETIARSLSNMAEGRLDEAKAKKLEQIIGPYHQIEDTTGPESFDAYVKFGKDLISRMSQLLPREIAEKLVNIDFSVREPQIDALRISNQLREALGEDIVSRLEEENKIISSAVSIDQRPFRVATGDASDDEIRKLGNTFRDAVHMGAFAFHSNQIDLLQVDSRQLALIQRSKPVHRFREIGLDDRCFSVTNLAETLQYLASSLNQ